MSTSVDVQRLLDPEIASVLAKLDLSNNTLSAKTLPLIRAARAAAAPAPLSDAVQRTDHPVPDRPSASVRVHRARASDGPLPGMYWMHGGGLVLGTNLIDDPRFDRWCPALGCVGASVEYALAPESTYPGPLEDCYAGLRWLHTNAATLGIDPSCIGIGGSSAGAGLAAALALLARDRGEFPVAFQALIYPMLDDRQTTVSSQWQDPVWPPQANRFGWSSYLGDIALDEVTAYAAAARATDLQSLPPTFISVGA
ncbi:MAG: alpha/beta hydrolase fold domain-containing protein, partial [Chromatiales bacterium]|nr:alpha/beta hydrolase fold domain-containing protein [Chromatiales bacterium]